MTFSLPIFLFGSALVLLGSAQLARSSLMLWSFLGAGIIAVLLSATVSPAFLILPGFTIVGVALRTQPQMAKRSKSWVWSPNKEGTHTLLTSFQEGFALGYDPHKTPKDTKIGTTLAERSTLENPFRSLTLTSQRTPLAPPGQGHDRLDP